MPWRISGKQQRLLNTHLAGILNTIVSWILEDLGGHADKISVETRLADVLQKARVHWLLAAFFRYSSELISALKYCLIVLICESICGEMRKARHHCHGLTASIEGGLLYRANK